jgi:AcrR family transcriptional regulator
MTAGHVPGILSSVTTETAKRTPGRPRSSEADQAILQTTLRLLVEQGYDAMSIEGVASAAGVGKTTIYRRYPSKRELVVAAMSSLARSVHPPPESGDLRADLLMFIQEMLGALRMGPGFSVVGTLMVKEREDPELLDLFRQQVILPRMQIVAELLRRGIARGDLRADIPVEVAVQMLAGAVFARHISGWPEDDAWLQSVVDTLWRGIAVRG